MGDQIDEDDRSESLSDVLDARNEEGWEDVEEDHEVIAVTSLFDDRTFVSARGMLVYCREKYGFDIWKVRQDLALDFIGLVKLANYVRSEVKAGKVSPDVSSRSIFEDEKYLKPALEDDALLYSLDDVFEDDLDATNEPGQSEVQQLREELANLQAQFTAYREDVQAAMLQKLRAEDSEPGSSNPSRTSDTAVAKREESSSEQIEKGYFESYSYNSIHELMIKDKIRTDAYRDFIYDNKQLFLDKVVLDVGCGTGILSMFCAKAGAKMVIAVDNSNIIEKTRENVYNNGLQDKVKCIRGKIEEVTLPVTQVDIVVSEWMGYGLLYESMLDSVIYARDKYLKPDGLMVPSHATIRLAPLADSDLKASHIDFWRDIYGFDMTAMLEKAHEEALIRLADAKELGAESVPVLQLDLHSVKVQDLDFTSSFKLNWKGKSKLLEGFVIWFDIFFLLSRTQQENIGDLTMEEARRKGIVAFSTGPSSEPTHWQQVVFLIEDPTVEVSEGDVVDGTVSYRKKTGQERSLDIDIEWAKGEQKASKQTWFLD